MMVSAPVSVSVLSSRLGTVKAMGTMSSRVKARVKTFSMAMAMVMERTSSSVTVKAMRCATARAKAKMRMKNYPRVKEMG